MATLSTSTDRLAATDLSPSGRSSQTVGVLPKMRAPGKFFLPEQSTMHPAGCRRETADRTNAAEIPPSGTSGTRFQPRASAWRRAPASFSSPTSVCPAVKRNKTVAFTPPPAIRDAAIQPWGESSQRLDGGDVDVALAGNHASRTIFVAETARFFVEKAMPIRVTGLPERRNLST